MTLVSSTELFSHDGDPIASKMSSVEEIEDLKSPTNQTLCKTTGTEEDFTMSML